MGKRAPVAVTRQRNRLECEVLAIPDWEGFEKLAQFLEKHYDATVTEKADGPDARRWVFDVGGRSIALEHEDPWGNTLVAVDAASEDLLTRVASDLAIRLADVEAQD